MSDDVEILKRIEKQLQQLLKWTRFAGMQQLRNILSQSLTDDKSMLAYEFSDGSRTTREIARIAGVKSNATIANFWKQWNKLGIVEPSLEHKGRFQRICSLEEVGLTVPPRNQTVGNQNE